MSYNKMNFTGKTHKGLYTPINPNKYIGDLSMIKYNSSWELKFMQFCDVEDNVVKWGSELDNIVVPYELPDYKTGTKKIHRYYPDFYMEIKTQNPNIYRRYVIEIKPWAETMRPIPPKTLTGKALESYEYKVKTYTKNIVKWCYAKEYFKRQNIEFRVLDETYFEKYGFVKIF